MSDLNQYCHNSLIIPCSFCVLCSGYAYASSVAKAKWRGPICADWQTRQTPVGNDGSGGVHNGADLVGVIIMIDLLLADGARHRARNSRARQGHAYCMYITGIYIQTRDLYLILTHALDQLISPLRT